MSSLQSSGMPSASVQSNIVKPDALAAGYPRLADFMSKWPETQIFRSFHQLNILNILRLQAELHDLDRRLTETQRLDEIQNSDAEISNNKSFSAMRSDETSDEDSQASLLEEIDRKLERYIANMSPDTALLQLFQLRSVQSPRKQDMDSLLEYLRGHIDKGVNFLRYPERDTWPKWDSGEYRDRIIEEYVTTDPRASKRDYFSILLEGALLNMYHGIWLRLQRSRGEKPSEERSTTYKARHLETISTSVAVALASLLPGVAMLVLYHVNHMIWRIFLALVFTTVFSAFLKIFTAARTAEIYAATAAFAAVVVVFIGSDNLNKDKG